MFEEKIKLFCEERISENTPSWYAWPFNGLIAKFLCSGKFLMNKCKFCTNWTRAEVESRWDVGLAWWHNVRYTSFSSGTTESFKLYWVSDATQLEEMGLKSRRKGQSHPHLWFILLELWDPSRTREVELYKLEGCRTPEEHDPKCLIWAYRDRREQ